MICTIFRLKYAYKFGVFVVVLFLLFITLQIANYIQKHNACVSNLGPLFAFKLHVKSYFSLFYLVSRVRLYSRCTF